MVLKPIGVIRTPFAEPGRMPVNVRAGRGVRGTVHVYARYAAGLRDLRGFDRIWLIFWLHRAPRPRLIVRPFLGRRKRGLFATRAPARPNPIGISCVRLLGVRANILRVSDLDIVDGTPLLDIKPYQPSDRFTRVRFGWMDRVPRRRMVADGRFAAPGGRKGAKPQ
jgi:tRNA-Thr(GGU) m(6)t(6)A37 methyltransferase TsaA